MSYSLIDVIQDNSNNLTNIGFKRQRKPIFDVSLNTNKFYSQNRSDRDLDINVPLYNKSTYSYSYSRNNYSTIYFASSSNSRLNSYNDRQTSCNRANSRNNHFKNRNEHRVNKSKTNDNRFNRNQKYIAPSKHYGEFSKQCIDLDLVKSQTYRKDCSRDKPDDAIVEQNLSTCKSVTRSSVTMEIEKNNKSPESSINKRSRYKHAYNENCRKRQRYHKHRKESKEKDSSLWYSQRNNGERYIERNDKERHTIIHDKLEIVRAQSRLNNLKENIRESRRRDKSGMRTDKYGSKNEGNEIRIDSSYQNKRRGEYENRHKTTYESRTLKYRQDRYNTKYNSSRKKNEDSRTKKKNLRDQKRKDGIPETIDEKVKRMMAKECNLPEDGDPASMYRWRQKILRDRKYAVKRQQRMEKAGLTTKVNDRSLSERVALGINPIDMLDIPIDGRLEAIASRPEGESVLDSFMDTELFNKKQKGILGYVKDPERISAFQKRFY